MANHFVSNGGSNGNSGHDLDNSWATVEYSLESGSLVAGDIVWVRRDVDETPGSDIACAYDGGPDAPIYVIGCPRPAIPNTTITQADFTNGSTTVDNIVGITCDRRQHQGRYITTPDGSQYMITRVVDSNTVIIGNECAGSTVTGTDGKFQIEADEDYALFNAIDDSGWTIKIADWNSDAINLPRIDFNDGNFQMALSGDYYHRFKNMEFKDSTDIGGIVKVSASGITSFIGCLFKQSAQNDVVCNFLSGLIIAKRTIFEGSGAGNAQVGLYITSGGHVRLIDSAIYNAGDVGLHCNSGSFELENVNIGVEIANGDVDISMRSSGGKRSFGRNVKLGGTNGYIGMNTSYSGPYQVSFENYGKVLGAHKTFYHGGTWEKAAVSGETPNKKVSDDVFKISPNVDYQCLKDAAQIMFTDEFEVAAAEASYKYWLYNDTGDTLNDGDARGSIWLELEYVSRYDDNTEYTILKEYSAQTNIADAADADDWDYLEITSITPATASKVRIICRCRHYTASGDIFVDPATVIS